METASASAAAVASGSRSEPIEGNGPTEAASAPDSCSDTPASPLHLGGHREAAFRNTDDAGRRMWRL